MSVSYKKNMIVVALVGLSALSLASCASKKVRDTGKVAVVVEKEVVNKKTGEVSVVAERLDEIAARSIADKGAESLGTPQKVVNFGGFFSAYDIGKDDAIVASVFNQEGRGGADLWVYAGGKRRLTKTNYVNASPSFSSDGKFVYFASRKGKRASGAYDQDAYIWKTPSSGAGGITRIGTPSYSYTHISETSDGAYILFSSREFYANSPFVWYMERNGALPTQLKQGAEPSWVDDETIVFTNKDENTGLETIWTSKRDGSMLTQIIADEKLDCIQPAPSPNGRFIAFVKQKPLSAKKSKRDTKQTYDSRDIYVYDKQSGLIQQMTTNISRDDLPQWSDDGSYLYFRSSRGLSWNIWRISTSSFGG